MPIMIFSPVANLMHHPLLCIELFITYVVLRILNFSQDANNNASEMSQAKKIAELEEKLKQKDAEILGYQVSNKFSCVN